MRKLTDISNLATTCNSVWPGLYATRTATGRRIECCCFWRVFNSTNELENPRFNLTDLELDVIDKKSRTENIRLPVVVRGSKTSALISSLMTNQSAHIILLKVIIVRTKKYKVEKL